MAEDRGQVEACIKRGRCCSGGNEKVAARLYVVLGEDDHEYGVYQLDADVDKSGGNSSSIRSCEPILKLAREAYPEDMSFIGLDSKIYMVGGTRVGEYPGRGRVLSNEVFVYDTLSCRLFQGPPLNSGKYCPYLFTVGTEIYAFSRALKRIDHHKDMLDPKPRFEVLDTTKNNEWVALPLPRLHVFSTRRLSGRFHAIRSSVVCGSTIFISVENAKGTYAFDVVGKQWKYVSKERLPFQGLAGCCLDDDTATQGWAGCCLDDDTATVTGLFYAQLPKCFRAFRFRYHANGHCDCDFPLLSVIEIEIEFGNVSEANWSGSPIRISTPSVYFPFGERVYFAQAGLDKPVCCRHELPNRYLLVSAHDIGKVEVKKKKKNNNDMKRRKDHHNRPGATEYEEIERSQVRMKSLWNKTFLATPIELFRHGVLSAFAM